MNNLKLFFIQKIDYICTVFLFVICILIATFKSLDTSIDIPTSSLDGAYQTASSLYRLNGGEYPGKDFFPYLGIGPVFLLYPLFKFAGANISASVFSSHFVVFIQRIFSVWLVAFLYSKKKKFVVAFVVSSLFLLLTSLIELSSFSFLSLGVFAPGSSLRPIRGFLPYLIALCLYLIITTRCRLIRKYDFCFIGIISGFCILWSNDFGFPTAFFTMLFFYGYKFENKSLSLRIILLSICSTFLSAISLLHMCTHGHTLDMLSYNFIDVRSDQYWYFGLWREEGKIFFISDIFTKILTLFSVLFPTLLTLLLFTSKLKNIKSTNYLEIHLLFFVAIVLFSGGTVACIGGHISSGYFGEYAFFSFILLMSFLMHSVLFKINYLNTEESLNLKDLLTRSVIVFTFLLIFILGLQMNRYFANLSFAKSDNSRYYVRNLGGYLPITFKQHINMSSHFSSDEVIEDYWGLWSAFNRSHTSVPVDSVIHALGSTRYKYLMVLERLPRKIITLTNSSSFEWQPWNFSANYWFYKILLENYEPMQTSPNTLVWTRSVAKNGSAIECKINGSGESFSLVDAIPGYYEVTINADISLKGRSLALVKNNINYALDARGYLSLDPTKSSFVFPIRVNENSKEIFDIQFSQPYNDIGNTFNISSCKAYTIPILHEQVTPTNNMEHLN